MSTVRAWRSLIRIKERRLTQQEEAVQAAQAELADCQAELLQAEQAETLRRAEWAQARRCVRDLLDGDDCFKPDLLITRRHQVEEREQALRRAEGDTERHRQRVRVAEHELQMARAQWQRLEHQLELAREALAKALQAHEQAQEDQQDEDAEETAVARLVAAVRTQQGQGEGRGARV